MPVRIRLLTADTAGSHRVHLPTALGYFIAWLLLVGTATSLLAWPLLTHGADADPLTGGLVRMAAMTLAPAAGLLAGGMVGTWRLVRRINRELVAD